MNNIILSLNNIVKTYPGVTALNDVSVQFMEGEVHALMGENGAGKSTLIKTLSGAIVPDSGSIEVDGERFEHLTPLLSKKHGVGVVYQEFNLFPALSVYENIFMGDFIGEKGFVDHKTMLKKVEQLFKEKDLKIDAKEKVGNLSVGYMQLVEIFKVIFREVKILVLDEPTAPLTSKEVEILFKLIEQLKAAGVTIIYISHRINEIYQIADRVTVLRDGVKIATHEVSQVSREELIKEMVGRVVSETFPSRECMIGKSVLQVRNLCGNGIRNINFEVREGEILGLAGLVGAGRTEIVRMIFGADEITGGTLVLEENELKPKSPKQAVEAGIALIPEDRKNQGVLLNASIESNISLAMLKKISLRGFINRDKEMEMADTQIQDMRIKTPGRKQLVKNLSGGNQQKVVLGKWMAGNSKVFIFDEPTRGIDVGAKQEIYKLMNELAAQKKAIIMISSEMEEIIGMSDRILVLCEGEQMAILNKNEFSQEAILSYASGINRGE